MLEQLPVLLLGCGVLIVVIFLWFAAYYWLNPQVENPDGAATVTGSCGDTMEIRLKFRADRVVESSHWTNGCAHSLNAVCTAAELAHGKSPDEIVEISAEEIRHAMGGLPRDHMHCARLAEETLQAALENYMLNRRDGYCRTCAGSHGVKTPG